MSELPLDDLLERWVAQGLIEPAQAARIKAAEAARSPVRAAPARPAVARPAAARPAVARPAAQAAMHRSLIVEALGYLGGALAVIAGFLAVAELWPDITTEAELVFAALGGLVLAGAGAAVRPDRDAALERLRQVLWLLSALCLTAFTGLLAAQIWEWGGEATALFSAAATAGYGLVLWSRTHGVLQQLVVFAALAVTVGSAIAMFEDNTDPWAPGIGVWLFAVLWAAATLRDVIGPRDVGLLYATVGLIVGAQMTMSEAFGQVLALLTLAALFAAGVRLRAIWLLALAALDVILTVPQTASRYLPASAAAPIAIFAVAATLLATALWMARRNRKDAHAHRPPERAAGSTHPGRPAG